MAKQPITLEDLHAGQQDLYAGQQLLIKLMHGFGNELAELRAYTEAGFDTLNERFDRLENRMDK